MSPFARKIAGRVLGQKSRWPVDVFPPVPTTPEAIATAEQTLGFSLPPLLRELYVNVRNGTFGPGPGLLPVGGRKVGNPGLSLENQYRAALTYGADTFDDPTLQWPQRLLPLSDWGCDIYLCTQCGTSDYPIVRFDPNKFRPDTTWAACFTPEAASLGAWLEAWLREGDRFRQRQ